MTTCNSVKSSLYLRVGERTSAWSGSDLSYTVVDLTEQSYWWWSLEDHLCYLSLGHNRRHYKMSMITISNRCLYERINVKYSYGLVKWNSTVGIAGADRCGWHYGNLAVRFLLVESRQSTDTQLSRCSEADISTPPTFLY